MEIYLLKEYVYVLRSRREVWYGVWNVEVGSFYLTCAYLPLNSQYSTQICGCLLSHYLLESKTKPCMYILIEQSSIYVDLNQSNELST